MSLTRRSILALLGAAPVSGAASSISRGSARRLAGLPPAPTMSSPGPEPSVAVASPPSVDGWYDLIHALHAQEFADQARPEDMPYWIASKRSWSRAFKAGEAAKHKRRMLAFEQALRESEEFRSKVVSVLKSL